MVNLMQGILYHTCTYGCRHEYANRTEDGSRSTHAL